MTESPADSLLCDAEQDRMQRLNALRNPLTDPVKRRIAAQSIADELKFIEIDLQKAAMFDELVNALHQAADTFSDTERVFRLFGKPLAAAAMTIAAIAIREIVAKASELQKVTP